jgi:hypothetical protein
MKWNTGDKVDVVARDGSRQRAIVVKGPTGKRGRGAAVLIRVTRKGVYPTGLVQALQADLTTRMNTRYMR